MLEWFDQHGRKDLPWQSPKTPYRVWIAEIMLQQTQVTTVIPYYEKFLKRFPNINTLASAHMDDVLHLWSGLGYYARARNIHRTANIIQTELNGEFPNTVETLKNLPGIGKSTAGAIAACAFNQVVPILDGNVKRVLCRFYCVKGDPREPQVEAKLWKYSSALVSQTRPADYTQAIMDLGATLCTQKNPQCDRCPLMTECQAYQTNSVLSYPEKNTSTKKPEKFISVLILKNKKQEILLLKRPEKGIWGGLWSFPEFQHPKEIPVFLKQHAFKLVKKQYELDPISHVFTHFKLWIQPILCEVETPNHMTALHENFLSVSKIKKSKGIPAPIQKIILNLENTKQLTQGIL